MHLKADNASLANQWVEALTGLVEFYKYQHIVDWLDVRENYKSRLDIRLYVNVMKEQESEYFCLKLSAAIKF